MKMKQYQRIKRIADILISIICLIILIPLNLIIIIVLRISQGMPIIFSQERIGLNGKKFKIYKYRTMKINAEELKKEFNKLELDEYNENFKLQNDYRVTSFGKILRRTCLDEIPQFFNIIKGDMALIGPRPIVEEELAKYKEQKEKFFSIKPGLIGYWQAYVTKETTYKERIEMELYYIENENFLFDIKIFFKSISTIIKKMVNF